MKKKAYMTVVTMAMVSSLMLSGCEITTGQNGNNTEGIITQTQNPDNAKHATLEGEGNETDDTKNDNDKEKEPETGNDVIPDEVLVSETELFEEFLVGDGKGVSMIGDIEWTLDEMVNDEAEMLEDTAFFEGYPTERYYDYIDCGMDGIPELIVNQRYESFDGYQDLDRYYIFKVIDNKVRLIDIEETQYRSMTDILKSGVIISYGSGGAALGYYEMSFIDADGNKQFVYSLEQNLALSYPIIPYYYIPDNIRPADYPTSDDLFSAGDDYECDAYSFMKYDGYDTSINYQSSYFYAFCNSNEEKNVDPDASVKDFYDNNGIKYYTNEEIAKMIEDREKELGMPDGALDETVINLKEPLFPEYNAE